MTTVLSNNSFPEVTKSTMINLSKVQKRVLVNFLKDQKKKCILKGIEIVNNEDYDVNKKTIKVLTDFINIFQSSD